MATSRRQYIGVWTSVDTLRRDPLTLEALENFETLEYPQSFEDFWPGTVNLWIFVPLKGPPSHEKLEIFEYL